jgi:hypothetical protein
MAASPDCPAGLSWIEHDHTPDPTRRRHCHLAAPRRPSSSPPPIDQLPWPLLRAPAHSRLRGMVWRTMSAIPVNDRAAGLIGERTP